MPIFNRRLIVALSAVVVVTSSVAAADDSSSVGPFDPIALFHRAKLPSSSGQSPQFALVLSGGGARGLAHIGVLQELEHRGLRPSLIVGTSMGAVMGGLYAAGVSADSLATLARTISWGDLLGNEPPRAEQLLAQKEHGAGWFLSIPFRRFRPDWPAAVSTGQNLSNLLWRLTLAASYRACGDFDSLPIPFRAVATDLATGEAVVLDHGDLAWAARASVAFPLAVTPLTLDGRRLMDGGLVDPLPVDVARSLDVPLVIAVNAASELLPPDQLRNPYALANQATSIMTQRLLDSALADADIAIVPDLSGLTNLDFGAVDELIARGRAAARLALEGRLPAGTASSDPDAPSHSAVPIIRRVVLTGNTAFEDHDLPSVFGYPAHGSYTVNDILRGMRAIIDLYRDHDLILADFTGWSYNSRSQTLTLAIDEGWLAGIDIAGNQGVRDWVIHRNVPLRPGEPFDAGKAWRALNDLHAGGLFELVTAEIVRGYHGPRLRIVVTEKSTDYLRLGLHHNLEYQTEAFAQLVRANLFGAGAEVLFHAQYSPRRELYRLGLRSDRIFRTYLTARVGGYSSQHEIRRYENNEDIGFFETDEQGFTVSVGQHVLRTTHLSVALDRSEIDLEMSGDSNTTYRQVATIAASIRLDDRDRAVLPNRGQHMTASVVWADDLLGGDIIYRAVDAAATKHLPVSSVWNTWFSARFASADRKLPIYRKFALGGRRSFYGLSDHEMLGDKLFATSVGLRWKAYSRSYLFGRADIGTVWGHNDRIDFWRDLRVGFGGGLAFDTPLGPLEISGGIAEGDASQFYFHWGYEF